MIEINKQMIRFQETASTFNQNSGDMHEDRRGLSVHSDTADEEKSEQLPSDDSNHSSKQSHIREENLWEDVPGDQQILPADDSSDDRLGDEEWSEQAKSAALSSPESLHPSLTSPEEKNQESELCISSVISSSEPQCPLLTATGPGSPLFSSPRSSPELATSSPDLSLPQLSPYSGFVDDV